MSVRFQDAIRLIRIPVIDSNIPGLTKWRSHTNARYLDAPKGTQIPVVSENMSRPISILSVKTPQESKSQNIPKLCKTMKNIRVIVRINVAPKPTKFIILRQMIGGMGILQNPENIMSHMKVWKLTPSRFKHQSKGHLIIHTYQ